MAEFTHKDKKPLSESAIEHLKIESDVRAPWEREYEERDAKILFDAFLKSYGEFIPEDRIKRLKRKKLYKRIVTVDDPTFGSLYDMWSFPGDNTGSDMSEIGVRYYTHSVIGQLGWHQISGETDVEDSIKLYQKALDTFGEDVHRVYFGQDVDEAVRERITAFFNPENTKGILGSAAQSHLDKKMTSAHTAMKKIRAISYSPDMLIVLKDTTHDFDRLNKDSQKRLLRHFNGDETRARHVISEIFRYQHVLHEMIHQFEPPSDDET